jgi:hypothetical protein
VRDVTVLYEPTVGVRDVLSDAAQRFVELGDAWGDSKTTRLGQRVALLAANGLDDVAVTRAIAADIESLLDATRVPGIPRPEDDYWGF